MLPTITTSTKDSITNNPFNPVNPFNPNNPVNPDNPNNRNNRNNGGKEKGDNQLDQVPLQLRSVLFRELLKVAAQLPPDFLDVQAE